jgi:hypothetical protein
MSDLISFSSTATEAGLSKAKKWLGCTARAAADERQEAERNGEPWPLFPEEGKPVPTAVGSLLGELQQRFYRGEPVRDSARFAWNGESIEQSHPLTCAEVRRLYKAYTTHHDPDGLGEVLGCEVQIEIPESLFGMRLTGAIDLVTRRHNGVWLWDFKTEGSSDKFMREKFSLNYQLWALALGYELLTGEKPVGVGNEITIKTKTPVFQRLEFESLTEARLQWLKQMFEDVKAAKAAPPRARPCEDHCLAFYKACPYLVGGMCGLL